MATSSTCSRVFLLAANGFYVAAEFALVKSRGFRIDALAEEGRVGARLTQNMLKQRRGLSRLLPARHHHGLARPRLGRRADRRRRFSNRCSTRSACRSRRSTSPPSSSASSLLLASHRPRRAGAEDPGDPRARAGVAVDRLSAARRLPSCSFRLNWLLNSASRSILAPARRQGGAAPGHPDRRRDRGPGRGLGRARQDGGEPGRVHPQPLPLRRARGRRRHGPPHQHALGRHRRAAREGHRRRSWRRPIRACRSGRTSRRTSSASSTPRIS